MKNIKILGSHSDDSILLEFHTQMALEELGWEASIEKVTDLNEIKKYKIFTTPALIVNEKVIYTGKPPKTEELKQILQRIDRK